jgi:simple sugar transport system substrate-binding protein
MKKVLSLVLVLLLVLTTIGFVACSGAEEAAPAPAEEEAAPAEEEAAPAEEAASYDMTTVVKVTNVGWFQRMKEGVEQFGADRGHTSIMDGPADEGDAAKQNEIMENLIAEGVDAICLVPMNVQANEPVLKRAMDAGIVVVTHEASSIENADYDIEAFDNVAFGAKLREELIKQAGDTGTYGMFVGGLSSETHMQWQDGGESIMGDYPNLVAVDEGRVETADNSQQAFEKAKELIKKYPDLVLIQGCASTDAEGACKAIEEAGLTGKVFFAGAGLVGDNQTYIEKGLIGVMGGWDPKDAGYVMNVIAEKVLDGKTAELVDGANFDLPGYEDCSLDGKVFYGKAWYMATPENYENHIF